MFGVIATHFKEGGWGMYPIVVWLIIVGWIIVDRTRVLVRASIDKDAFLTNIQKCVLAGDVARAKRLCESTDAPLSRIVKAGLSRLQSPDAQVQIALDEAALREVPMLEKRTAYLALLSNLAMLSGLLGTITGLIGAFHAVGSRDAHNALPADQKAQKLAEGISEAMNCTAFGLMVAIIGLIAFALLNGKTQAVVDEINEGVVQVMNLVTQNRSKLNLAGLEQQAA